MMRRVPAKINAKCSRERFVRENFRAEKFLK